ncbi:MAG: universal stress protein [Nitrosopumilus sp.]|nr:universal stress protein [Nitrosopumilus sp.]MDH3501529.1 universal stress protein [Nitrosopumilus sp.]
MFKQITVAIITPTHDKKAFDLGLKMAKKLDCALSVIECFYQKPPMFHFFETKADKQSLQTRKHKIDEELVKWKKIAEREGILIKTKFALTDSIAHWVIDYVSENEVELLIVDYPKLSMTESTHYDDIINTIHHKAKCHILTTKQY